jgi:hypothetical protein
LPISRGAQAYPNPSDLWREERPLIEVIRELERR